MLTPTFHPHLDPLPSRERKRYTTFNQNYLASYARFSSDLIDLEGVPQTQTTGAFRENGERGDCLHRV